MSLSAYPAEGYETERKKREQSSLLSEVEGMRGQLAAGLVDFLVDGGYMQKMLRDPLNNFDSHTCDIGWGATNCPGFAYFYYCYQTGYDYPQFVIGARLERSPGGQIANSLGWIAGSDGVTYYYGAHNIGKNINGVGQCQ